MVDYQNVDYQNGKIYKIVSENCDLIYIGSTAKYDLKDRLKGHVSNFECGVYYSSAELIKQIHYDIIEVEAYPCNSKAALTAQERFWILKYRADGINVVNINIPSGIEADNRADWYRQYREDNKEKIQPYQYQYRQDNKEQLTAKAKQNYQNNKEKISKLNEQYRQDNKEKIKEKAATKVTCDCGCEVRKDSLPKHKKTKRHIKLMSTM